MDCSAWYSCRLSTFIAPVRLLATLLWPFGGHCRRHALRIFQVHRDKDIRKLRKNQASVDTRRICRSSRLHGSCCCPRYITGIWAFRATSRQNRLTDLCWETHAHRPPLWRTTSFHHRWKRIGAKWIKRRMTASSNESCHMAWNFMRPWLPEWNNRDSKTTCQWWNASEAGKHQRERLKGTEWLWKTVYHGSKRMFMKHPEERFVSFWFGLQVTPNGPCLVNRTSCVHSEDWCDATWRPTEVYIDFSRPPRSWKRWCLPDNGGR